MREAHRQGFLRAGLAALCLALLRGQSPPDAVDPLTARVELDDAERFAALFAQSGGAPTPADLKGRYLDQGGRALAIFTPHRIVDADNLARAIADAPADYAEAIARCLPLVRRTEPDLRRVYLGFRGLLPDKPLPRIAVVFGAGNSGGTAAPGMQVLGLEVLCRIAPDEAAFRTLMRDFYAHETVHSFQQSNDEAHAADPLLAIVLAEGTADYLAQLVTGAVPQPDRALWAEAHVAMVWREFAADLAISRDPALPVEARAQAIRRWVGNAGSPPDGWPSELGYWVGMQIAAGYVASAADPHAAIATLLTLDHPDAVLAGSAVVLPQP